jgi:hypothetical protein
MKRDKVSSCNSKLLMIQKMRKVCVSLSDLLVFSVHILVYCGKVVERSNKSARLNKGLVVISVSVTVSVAVMSTGGLLGWLLLVQSLGLPPCPSESIKFSAQLLLFELPLPVFFCFTSWSVLVSLSSPPSPPAYANGDVANNPVNAAAIRTAAIAIALLFMY